MAWFLWAWRLQNHDNASWAAWEREPEGNRHQGTQALTALCTAPLRQAQATAQEQKPQEAVGMKLWLEEQEACKT